jgi:hypothetical protein
MAVAIETRFLGPTNYRGSRISARLMESHDGSREKVIVSWDHALSPVDNYAVACRALLAKLHADAVARRSTAETCGDAKGEQYQTVWSNLSKWVSGATDRGYVWVHVGTSTLVAGS